MGWIVQGSAKSAEAAGADPEGDRVMFAITPNYLAEVYNRYRNNVDERTSWGSRTGGECSRMSRGRNS